MTDPLPFGSTQKIRNNMKFLLAFLFIGSSVFAKGQTISTDAPSVSASANTVPKSSVQFESSFGTTLNVIMKGNETYQFNLPSLLVRYGVADNIELRASATHELYQNYAGIKTNRINGVNIGAKFQVLNKPESKTQMALITDFNVYNQSNPYVGGSLIYALGHSFNDKHSLGFNAGIGHLFWQQPYVYHGITDLSSSLIYNFLFHPRMCVFGEIYGSSSKFVEKNSGIKNEDEFELEMGVDIGFLFLLKDDIQLDFATGASLEFDSYYASLGFSILLTTKE